MLKLSCVLVVCAWTVLVSQALMSAQPNVLVLIADDQRADTIAALGNTDIQTPALDRIAKRGFHVSSMYCMGSNSGAVCQPSRNMMLAGRSYFRWTPPGDRATYAPADNSSLPAVFGKAGYETYHHGKQGNTAALIHKQFHHSKYLDDFNARWNGKAGQEEVDQAIEFLTKRTSDKPWLMWLEFATPHDPRYASEDSLAKYAGRKLKLPENVLPVHPFENGAVLVRDEWTALWPRNQQALQDQWQDYYATISTLDSNIGRLLDHLETTSVFDNTIIVFTSDHGLAMGSHGLMGKQNVYDDGYKAPCILCGPGVVQGAADDPVYLMDIYPTLCELAGVEVPQGLDALSFASMVKANSGGPRKSVMLSYQESQRAVREGDWKLILYPKVGRQQLFNLRSDPHEILDLSDEPVQAGRIAAMKEQLTELQKSMGDPLKLEAAPNSDGSFAMPAFSPIADYPSNELRPDPRVTYLPEINSADDRIFQVMLEPNEQFSAIAVGYDRSDTSKLTGLRFDITGADFPDGSRKVLIAGDIGSRWAPLLDGMTARMQPVGIYGRQANRVRSLGFVMSDGHRTPAFGKLSDGDPFQTMLEKGALADNRLVGFYGSVKDAEGVKVINSIGAIYGARK